jgi:polysaccharide export outer membrane protein
LVYLQEKPGTPSNDSTVKQYQSRISAYKVQQGDVLNIKVLSQDPASVQPFNIDGQGSNVQMQLNLPQLYITGYTVDEKGNIDFPLIGNIFVRGKTIAEISEILAQKIDKYVTNATVKIKLVSFKVTVLGEVKTPGVHYIYNDRVSIMEVLGYSGDLNDLANRHKIKLIRTIGDQVQVSNIDLTDRRLVETSNYFLLPNDVLYVEPMKAKNFRLNLPTINLIVTSITTVLVILNFAIK